jgi:hypothetical protein
MGNGDVLQAVGKIAGIGGLSLGVLLLIFRDIIRRNIFPNLKQVHAYRLISLIVTLTFAIAAVGIVAYVYLQKTHGGIDDDGVIFPTTNSEPAMLAHLALIDEHRYAEAYAHLSSDAKKRFPYDAFVKAFEMQRAPRGKLLNRTMLGLSSASQLPDQTRGAFMTAAYVSDFENGGRYLEYVTTQAESGVWRVLFHTLGPCTPPVCK